MNLNKNTIPLTDIKLPNITDSKFANELKDAFDNINDNFKILANYEFVKGSTGDSIEIREVKFSEQYNEEMTYGQLLLQTIKKHNDKNYDTELTLNKNVYSIEEDFNHDDTIHLIFNTNEERPISSLYYTFLDCRFRNEDLGLATDEEKSKYYDIEDLSCVVIYDKNENDGNGGFKILNNIVPNVYYEKKTGFCWNINGVETGLPVQGIPGKHGLNAILQIVRASKIEDNNNPLEFKVDGVYETFSGYLDIETYKKENEIKDLNDVSSIIFIAKNDVLNTTDELTIYENNTYDILFGKLSYDEDLDELRAYSITNVGLDQIIFEVSIINMLKNANLLNTSPSHLKGLFIPAENSSIKKNTESPTRAHLLTASSITNIENNTKDLKTDVLFTPVEDIDEINVSEDKPFEIDKYLYLAIDTNSNIFASTTANNFANALDSTRKCKYLKYKLSNVVKSSTGEYFDIYNSIDDPGSRFYGNAVIDDRTVSLNTAKIVKDGISYDAKDEHLMSMPTKFLNKLNDDTSGLYRWTLCTDIDSYDIEELKNANKSDDGIEYKFDKEFNVIFTTTLTPSDSSDYMWFNAMELCKESTSDNLIIPGWSNIDEDSKTFKFIKLLPVYNKAEEFKMKADSALNVNYNVNITGDTEDSKKSLTVTGTINCDNLNALNITPIENIHNIKTDNDIYGDRGIHLAKKSSDEYLMNVDASGNLDAYSGKFKDIVNANHVVSNTTSSDNVISKNVEVISKNISNSITGKLHIGTSSLDSNKLGIHGDQIHEINIKSTIDETLINPDTYSINDVPVVGLDTPTHFYNGSNIVVSNQAFNTPNIYLKNAPNALKSETNVSYKFNDETDIIGYTSTESARNFNMHRLLLSQQLHLKDNPITGVIANDTTSNQTIGGFSKKLNDDNNINCNKDTDWNKEIVVESKSKGTATTMLDMFNNIGENNTPEDIDYIKQHAIQTFTIDKDKLKFNLENPKPEDNIPGNTNVPAKEHNLTFGLFKGINPYNINALVPENSAYIGLFLDKPDDTDGNPIVNYTLSKHFIFEKGESKNNVVSIKGYLVCELNRGDNITLEVDIQNGSNMEQINETLNMRLSEKLDKVINVSIKSLKWEYVTININNVQTNKLEYNLETEKYSFIIGLDDKNISSIEVNEGSVKLKILDTITSAMNYNETSSGNTNVTDSKLVSACNLNETSNINISFTNEYICHVGLNSRSLHGNWPMLHSDSKMYLAAFYSYIDNTDTEKVEYAGIYDEYTFDYSSSSAVNDTFDWRGYDESGKEFNKNYYDANWRYYAFRFLPNSMTISGKAYQKIVEKFNNYKLTDKNKKLINFFVVPFFYIKAVGQHDKELLKGIKVTDPSVYINSDNTLIKTIYNPYKLHKVNSGVDIKPFLDNYGTGKLSFVINIVRAENDDIQYLKNNVICDDGFTVRAGNYVFGLGMIDSEPSIFQYKFNASDNNKIQDGDENGLETGKIDYKKLTEYNAISILSLFDGTKSVYGV